MALKLGWATLVGTCSNTIVKGVAVYLTVTTPLTAIAAPAPDDEFEYVAFECEPYGSATEIELVRVELAAAVCVEFAMTVCVTMAVLVT
jgi:hypothetical protein